MTARAVILGLLGAAFICGYTYVNDIIIRQSSLVGSLMPYAPYGGLILFVLLVNPLLFYLHKRLPLSGKELAIIMTLLLAVCSIPIYVSYLGDTLILPYHFNRTEPSWQEQGVLEMTPKKMLVDTSQNESDVLDGFVRGMSIGEKHIPAAQVPWSAWRRPLMFWLPLIIAFSIALIGLSLVVHRQWTSHEHLSYPLVIFANSFLPQAGETSISIFRNKLFWLGTGIVFILYMNNYLCRWYPQYLVEVPLGFDFRPLGSLFPKFMQVGGARNLLYRWAWFQYEGIAYLLPGEISFSMGIAPFLWVAVAGLLIGYGISPGGALEGTRWSIHSFLLMGGHLGLFLTILYTGRYYYYHVFRKALFIPTVEQPEKQAVWGARTFLVFMVIFFIQITLTGLDWQLALLYAGLTVVIFLVMSRVLAETGVFVVTAGFVPGMAIWSLLGTKALGPSTMLIMSLLTLVLIAGRWEYLMPHIVNSLKLLDFQKVKVGRTALWCIVALLIGLTVAIPVRLYFEYDRGSFTCGLGNAAKGPYRLAVNVKQRLTAQGTLEQAQQVSGWKRFTGMVPNRTALVSLGAGLALVLLFGALRLRFPRWPLHPVIFLYWGTWFCAGWYNDFLVGWLIRTVVLKYGGVKAYQTLKPFMIGVIAGTLLAALTGVIFGAIYYLITGVPAKSFYVH